MSFNLEKYPLVLSQKIIWSDMDAFRHVNNKVYFRYFEDARIAYFDQTGITQYMEKHQIGPIVARTDCNFRLPLAYPGSISIATSVKLESEKKFTMDYIVYSDELEKVAADGTALVIFYDYQAGKSCPIPKELVEAINAIEGG